MHKTSSSCKLTPDHPRASVLCAYLSPLCSIQGRRLPRLLLSTGPCCLRTSHPDVISHSFGTVCLHDCFGVLCFLSPLAFHVMAILVGFSNVSRIENPAYLKFKETNWANSRDNTEDMGQENGHYKRKGKGKGKGKGEGADKDENKEDSMDKDNDQEKLKDKVQRLTLLYYVSQIYRMVARETERVTKVN